MQSFDTDPEDKAESPDAKRMFSVCPVEALPQGTCRRFFLPNGDELAIYNINGEYYATDNFCPHRGAALSEGDIRGYIVECGWHGWQFDIRNGECLTVTERIRTFRVTVEDGMVIVEA